MAGDAIHVPVGVCIECYKFFLHLWKNDGLHVLLALISLHVFPSRLGSWRG